MRGRHNGNSCWVGCAVVCCGVCRYLVEAPANVCTPRHLAAAAQHIRALNPDRFTLKVCVTYIYCVTYSLTSWTSG